MLDSKITGAGVNTVRTIGKNTAVMLLGTTLNAVASTLLAIFAARYLGDEKFGVYGFAVSFTALFSVFADLGLGTLAVREVAQDRSRLKSYLSSIWTIRWLLGCGLFLISCLVVTIMNRPQETRFAVYIISGSVFFGTLASCIRWGFQAFQVMKYDALYIIVLSLLRLTLGLAILIAGYGIVFFALSDLVANIALLVGIIWTARKKFGWNPHINWHFAFWKTLLRESYPLALMLVFATVYLNNGQVILSMFVGDAATGWYNAANKIVGLIRFLPIVFIPAIYPVMSEFYVLSRERFATVIQQSLRLLLMVGFPIAIYFTIFGNKIILLVYGNNYKNAIQPFRLLLWSVLFMFVSSVLGYGLISAGKQKANATITGIGAVLNIVLNLLLIPKYSAIGASMSLLIVEALVALLAILLMHKKSLLEVNTLRPLLWLPFAALVMGCMLFLLKGSMIMSAFIGIFVYALVLILTKSLSRADYQLISKLITIRHSS